MVAADIACTTTVNTTNGGMRPIGFGEESVGRLFLWPGAFFGTAGSGGCVGATG